MEDKGQLWPFLLQNLDGDPTSATSHTKGGISYPNSLQTNTAAVRSHFAAELSKQKYLFFHSVARPKSLLAETCTNRLCWKMELFSLSWDPDISRVVKQLLFQHCTATAGIIFGWEVRKIKSNWNSMYNCYIQICILPLCSISLFCSHFSYHLNCCSPVMFFTITRFCTVPSPLPFITPAPEVPVKWAMTQMRDQIVEV